IVGYYDKMAELTGTLWEHDDVLRGSLNHGFASYAGVAIIKCLLGVHQIAPAEGAVVFDFADLPITASGTIQTELGELSISRERVDGKTVIRCGIPPGMNYRIQNVDQQIVHEVYNSSAK